MRSTRRRAGPWRLAIACAFLATACGPAVPSSPRAVEVEIARGATGAASPSAPLARDAPSVEQRCADALAGFGDKAAEAGWELESLETELRAEERRCRDALTTSAHRESCSAMGKLDDYEACVLSCMRSVQIPAPYIPGDVVDNCESPCAQSYQCE